MSNLEPFASFKERILELSLEEQLIEVKKRQIMESLDSSCPHCGSSERKFDISLVNSLSKLLFCSECHSSWDTGGKGDHYINMDHHPGVCIK